MNAVTTDTETVGPIDVPAPGDYAIACYLRCGADSIYRPFYTITFEGRYVHRDTIKHGSTMTYATLQSCLRRIADHLDEQEQDYNA